MGIYERNNARALAANPDGKRRGPRGHRLCRWCGKETKPPRQGFCSDSCAHEWTVRHNANYARRQVWNRDQGVCAMCGTNTVRQAKQLRREFRLKPSGKPPARKAKGFRQRLERLHIPMARWLRSGDQGCWDVDHIRPVIEGGGSCGLRNLRTLCLRCHYRQTQKLRRRQRWRKRRQRLLGKVFILTLCGLALALLFHWVRSRYL
jgi:hypothetical protein